MLDQVLLYGTGTYRVTFMAKGFDLADNSDIGAGMSWHYDANILPGNRAPLTEDWQKYTFDMPLEESQIRPSNKMCMAIIARNGAKVYIDDVDLRFVGK